MRKADIAASPIPVAEVRAISMMSLFLLKYWPTIRVAGSLVIATPKPENGTFMLDKKECKGDFLQIARVYIDRYFLVLFKKKERKERRSKGCLSP